MAGDWIKMRMDLQTHPKVVRIMSALNADRLRVIGGLHAVWCVFDAHSSDGDLEGYTLQAMDDIVAWPGFSSAMLAVGWLSEVDGKLVMPRFSEHNGKSAKRRATETERKRAARSSEKEASFVCEVSALIADKSVTREEKRRDKEIPLCTPPKQKSKSVTLTTWLADIKAKGEKPVSDYAPLWTYVEKVGLPLDFVELAWLKFRDRYTRDEKAKRKRYIDWRDVFHKAVSENWFRLWFWSESDNSGFRLTTTGVQADKATLEEAAA